jgi:hypothetical protein
MSPNSAKKTRPWIARFDTVSQSLARAPRRQYDPHDLTRAENTTPSIFNYSPHRLLRIATIGVRRSSKLGAGRDGQRLNIDRQKLTLDGDLPAVMARTRRPQIPLCDSE